MIRPRKGGERNCHGVHAGAWSPVCERAYIIVTWGCEHWPEKSLQKEPREETGQDDPSKSTTFLTMSQEHF